MIRQLFLKSFRQRTPSLALNLSKSSILFCKRPSLLFKID